MLKYIPQLINAVKTRRSYRNYLPSDLTSEDLEKLMTFINDLKPPFDHQVDASIHFVPDDMSIVFFKGPRRFAAFLAPPSVLDQAKLGFIGELLILYCESIHLGTCWIGHYNKHAINQILRKYLAEKNQKIIYCISPIGYVAEKINLIDIFSKKFLSKKSKHVDNFLHSNSLRGFPQKVRDALELACRAPSALNSQKWYYLVKKNENQISIELSKPQGYQHFKWEYYDIDVGTAAAHIWLGLVEGYLQPTVKLENINNNAVWTFVVSL
jgi:nitroreductase